MVVAPAGSSRRKCVAGDALSHLRAVTGPAHRALEGGLGLLDENLELDAYKNVLARFYGFWIGWQPQIAGLLQNDALLTPRRRLHLLEADLTALGVSRNEMAALPKCPLTELHDSAEALGSLYVLEGSTLGGKLIRGNVQRCLGISALGSCTYFNGFGAETDRMWRSFLLGLEAAPAADTPKIGNGAVATFDRLGWWLTRPFLAAATPLGGVAATGAVGDRPPHLTPPREPPVQRPISPPAQRIPPPPESPRSY
jgi:heme oxygenase (biliverdin-IX-beta and delta-forming)